MISELKTPGKASLKFPIKLANMTCGVQIENEVLQNYNQRLI